jgi:hypothetical protein
MASEPAPIASARLFIQVQNLLAESAMNFGTSVVSNRSAHEDNHLDTFASCLSAQDCAFTEVFFTQVSPPSTAVDFSILSAATADHLLVQRNIFTSVDFILTNSYLATPRRACIGQSRLETPYLLLYKEP